MIILKEETRVPKYDTYYHATFNSYLSSIKKYGLGAKQNKNWDISEPGKIYWAWDPDIAISFCESAEDVSDEVYDSGIVVLSISAKELKGVEDDSNIHDYLPDEIITSTGIIPFSKLTIFEEMDEEEKKKFRKEFDDWADNDGPEPERWRNS